MPAASSLATLSTTWRVCEKLSLWPRPATVSTPLSFPNWGNTYSRSPVSSMSLKAIDGLGHRSILFSSSAIRSLESIDILSFILRIASSDSWTILNSTSGVLSLVAKRIALSIRSGSSLYVVSGSRGVRMMPAARSLMPPNGSTNAPKSSFCRLNAIALIVKSLRFWSSSSVPSSTIGFLDSRW